MKKQDYGFLLLLAVFCFALYYKGLQYDFRNFDDQVQVAENPYLKNFSFKSINEIFSNFFVGMYQPVTTSFYLILSQLFGLKSSAFHGMSVFFHLFNSILVFRILIQFLANQKVVYLLTLLFLAHPLQVESVAWISTFSNLVYTFFILTAFISYLKYRATSQNKHFSFTLVLFLLACLSKSAAVIFPLLLILYDLYLAKKPKEILLNKIPFLLLSVVFGIVTIIGRQSAEHLSNLSQSFGLINRIFLVSHSILFYPLKFLLPINLSAFYPYPNLVNGQLPIFYYLSLPILITLGFLVYRYKENRIIWFGALWYLIGVALIVQIIPVGNQITTDRYSYFPMIGLLLILGTLIKYVSKRVLFPIGIAVIICFGYLSSQRIAIWENDFTLWNSVLKVYPKVPQAYNNLGSYALKQADQNTAFQNFNKAIELQPNYADAYSNRGNIYSNQGKSIQAIADFNKAIAIKPHADAYFNRANEYANAGKINLAIKDYTSSLQLIKTADCYTNRAFAYLKVKNIEYAEQDLTAAIQLNPKFDRAYFLKGLVKREQGNLTEACRFFNQASKLGNTSAKKAKAQLCR